MSSTTPTEFALPHAFQAAGVACGIKSDPAKLDLAVFVSDVPCTVAGVFTQNIVCGAPVQVSRSRVPRASARAVVINSGNANACTGQRGLDDARWMTAEVADRLGCSADDVLVCSTGVIGHFLPREKLAAGIPRAVDDLASTPEAFARAARAMMTTDTVPKLAVRQADLDGTRITVSGAAKGAAMIGPNMATMLAVLVTDAALSPSEADAALRHAVDASFNSIRVEGHTSTSDTVLLFANGAALRPESAPAARPVASRGDARASDQPPLVPPPLQQLISDVCADLARQIVRDAEGAGHFVTIDVRGLRTRQEARRIAKVVADSALVKTAIAGNDPNWGRIVSAAGYAGVDLRETDITLRLNGSLLFETGSPVAHDAAAVSQSMATGEVHVELDFPLGDAFTRFWTSDLTTEYVRLNSEYTT
ncbi:MAG TPA: bifunctional glutamate N-acetyltransferase/amino-acid acetyltransferase ArgJ [Planctomycetaceae bacterium]|nr:bifunctional glutamate N-acetyltransferase/amino-acid acetyltransferase ArgJ [Planctomycetaceae bacterium]